MTRHIIVAITPDADGVRCGECIGINPRGICTDKWHCSMQSESPVSHDSRNHHRGPLCLAAERKLAALIEAGAVMKVALANMGHGPHWSKKWDSAVAEVK